ncbi:MAG: four helix bundle protein [Akkermansia sp.]|nr:four helix bundle protein [Akkermansia sp.]
MSIPLSEQALDFAVHVIRVCDSIHNRGVIKNQLLRAATSIGANIHEAQYGYSKDDFVYKLQIALKESNETAYWLQLLEKSQTISPEEAQPLMTQCSRIRYMLIKSINTAKNPHP